jgi:hypothetical protein
VPGAARGGRPPDAVPEGGLDLADQGGQVMQFCIIQEQFLGDLRCLLNMLVILIPMPVFWALYDQQSVCIGQTGCWGLLLNPFPFSD